MIAAASSYQALTNAVLLFLRLQLHAEFSSCTTSHFKSVRARLPGGSTRDTMTVGNNWFWLCANPRNFEVFSVVLYIYKASMYVYIYTEREYITLYVVKNYRIFENGLLIRLSLAFLIA